MWLYLVVVLHWGGNATQLYIFFYAYFGIISSSNVFFGSFPRWFILWFHLEKSAFWVVPDVFKPWGRDTKLNEFFKPPKMTSIYSPRSSIFVGGIQWFCRLKEMHLSTVVWGSFLLKTKVTSCKWDDIWNMSTSINTIILIFLELLKWYGNHVWN